MKIKHLIILIFSLLCLFGIILGIVFFMTTVRDEIDITDSALQTFSEFQIKALSGTIDTLNQKEQKMSKHWGEVSELCLKTMDDIVSKYATETIDYQQAIRALDQYAHFPVNSTQISSFKEQIEYIADGRKAYETALTTKDTFSAALLFSQVNERDSARYQVAKQKVQSLIDFDQLSAFVNIKLSKYEIEEARNNLDRIGTMLGDQSAISELKQKVEEYEIQQTETVIYRNTIEILSVRNLMAFPEIVYQEDSKYKDSYDSALITPYEFSHILESLHNNDFILISIESMDEEETLAEVKVPKGKKPFVLIIEDLSYPTSNNGSGIVNKLTLDEDGNLCTVTGDTVSYENESVLILEHFLHEHPDFTFRGARGCISITGYDGVFGHSLSDGSQLEEAKATANYLREQGWTFASNSYSYADMQKASLDMLKQDTETWLKKIGNILGETQVYIWPYGSSVRSGEKHSYLYEKGFRIFCGLGVGAYRATEPDGKGIFFDRKPLNGYSLRNRGEEYAHLFDSNTVIDPLRPNLQTDTTSQ